MKSKFEFGSLDDYREYLRTYFVGQILARTANGLPESTVIDTASIVVTALYPPTDEEMSNENAE